MTRKIKARAVSLLALLVMLLGGAVAVSATPAVADSGTAAVVAGRGAVNTARLAVAASLPRLDRAHTMKGTQAPKGRPGGFTVLSCPCYSYAGDRQTVASDGFGLGGLSVEKPAGVSTSSQHSLAELSVTDNLGNTIELGWITDTVVCGLANSPCIFTFWWKNGVPQGYNNSFTPAVGCAPCAGASISGAIGTTKQFGLQYITNANPALNAWWASYNGAYIGAWLASLWTAPAFTRGAFNQTFGEVVDSTASSCIDMFNGVLATAGGLGGKINSYTAVNPTGAGTLAAFATVPTKWNGVMATGISARAGGPGYC